MCARIAEFAVGDVCGGGVLRRGVRRRQCLEEDVFEGGLHGCLRISKNRKVLGFKSRLRRKDLR